MSYSYQVTERRRRTTANPGGYGASGNRSTFGYWVPLVLTVTAATIGLAAWVWSERRDDEDDASSDEHYPGGVPPPGYASMSGGVPAGPGPGPAGFQGPPGFMPGPPQPGGFQGPPPPGGGFQDNREVVAGTARSTAVDQPEETGLVARMSSALGMGRSASPAQSYDWASKKVVAGVAAAGAMVGGALTSLGGGNEKEYEDHERWSEEAEQRDNNQEIKRGIKRQGTADEFFSGAVEIPKVSSMSVKKRKTVAIVVSAVGDTMDAQADLDEYASILAHLPEQLDRDTTRVFVLIYSPDLKAHPLSPVATGRPSQSMTSSFSNISQGELHTPVQTPGDFPSGDEGILANVTPNPIDESSSLYKTLHNQAQALVEKDSMILPFTSQNGHKHILKSLSPEIVYIQESLCGPDGEVVSDISGWVRQTIVVIGDEGGHGGLVDTDDESSSKPQESWWQKEERTGLGKRVSVVESLKVSDDWRRRVNEQD